MVLNEQELLQIDEAFIHRLRAQDPDALAGLSIKLANDLKEAMERLLDFLQSRLPIDSTTRELHDSPLI